MNPSNPYNEPSRDPRRAHLRVDTGSTQQANGTVTGDSPQQPSQASPASTSMSMDSAVGIRIRGTAKNTDSKDDSNKAFGDFANNVTAYSTAAVRREQAVRKSRLKKSELRKTEEKSSLFPSLLNQSHRSYKAAGEELASVEKKLQEHLKVRNELVQTLSGGMSSNSSQEELEGMRSELEKTKLEMKEEVAKARQEAAQARDENERMKLEIQRIDRAVSETREHESRITAVQAETSRAESQLRSTSERMKDLSKSVNDAYGVSQYLKNEVETLKSGVKFTHTELNQRINSFQSKIDSNQKDSAAVSKINDTLSQHESLLDNLRNELRKLEKTASTAASASASTKVDPKNDSALEAITDDIQNLSKQIDDLWKYLEVKDEEVVKDSEQRGKATESVTAQLKQVRDDLDLLSRQSKEKHDEQTASREAASQSNSSVTSNPSVISMKQEVEQHTKLLTNNCHAIQSLELRYNNLTTDTIVRDMVREMQVMYPYASSTQEAIERIKAELGELSRKYPLDTESLNGRITQVSKDLETMRNDQTILLTKTAEKQTRSIDTISAQVRDINSASNDNTSRLEALSAAHTSSENERRSMVQTMNQERERIMDKFESISTAGISKQDQEEISRKLDDIKTRLENVETRLGDVETTTSKDVGKVDARVEVLENKFIERLDNPSSRHSMERASESSGEVPLALAAARKDSKPGQTPSRPPLLPPTKPKAMNNSVKPLKRKNPGSSSSTPQSAKGTPKPKKFKDKH